MKRFKLSVIIIMIGTLLSKVLGLVREILLAQKYGTGYISDSFIIALNIPNALIYSVAGAILTNYMPLLSEAEKESEERIKKFNGNLLSICFIISAIMILIFMIFSRQISKIFAMGFDDTALTYLANISRVTICSVFFILATHIFKGFLEYKGKFFATAIYGILMNIGIILGILFSSIEKYEVLGYGVVGGYLLSFIIIMILAKRNSFKAKLNVDFKDSYIKKMVILTLPMILNDAVWQINGIVDKSIASTIGEGYISAINYSHYIVDMISSIFATSIVTVFFPNIIKLFNTNGIEAVKEKTKEILKIIIFIAMPCTISISIFSKNIVKVLFGRGAFDEQAILITSIAVSIYSIALVFVCIKTILFKVFYALQDTKTPTKSAIIAIIFNILLSIILVKPFGYKGIIIATVMSSVISTIMLFVLFGKNYGGLIDKKFIYNILKIICATALMFIAIMILNNFININGGIISLIINTAICVLIGGIIYLLTLFMLKYNF